VTTPSGLVGLVSSMTAGDRAAAFIRSMTDAREAGSFGIGCGTRGSAGRVP
jgi:hypothetical protein